MTREEVILADRDAEDKINIVLAELTEKLGTLKFTRIDVSHWKIHGKKVRIRTTNLFDEVFQIKKEE